MNRESDDATDNGAIDANALKVVTDTGLDLVSPIGSLPVLQFLLNDSADPVSVLYGYCDNLGNDPLVKLGTVGLVSKLANLPE